MNIKLFFEISKEFFDLMYSPFIEDTIIENEFRENLYVSDDDEEKNISAIDKEKEIICGCNLCHITRKILLFINPRIYKKLNDNKVD
jgi:hypothetical protein